MKPNNDLTIAFWVLALIALLGSGFMWYVDTYADRQGSSVEVQE